MKDLGKLSKFLGIRATYDEDDRYHLEQAQGIREMHTGARMEQDNPARAPIGEE